jgi:hypothetical protein
MEQVFTLWAERDGQRKRIGAVQDFTDAEQMICDAERDGSWPEGYEAILEIPGRFRSKFFVYQDVWVEHI